jgi:phosphopantetheinyl transferase (holo-ACP synthase)
MGLRVGTDLVFIGTVRESIDTHAVHHLERVYTRREVEDCRGAQGIANCSTGSGESGR